MLKLSRTFFILFVLSLPLQAQSILSQFEWGRGLFNPYLSNFLGLTDLLLIAATLCFLLSLIKSKNKIQFLAKDFWALLLFSLLIAGLSLILSPFQDPQNHLITWIKLLELPLIFLLINNKVLKASSILELFVVTMSLQAILGIAQFLSQGDLGLQLLGEPLLNLNTAQLAKFNILNINFIRPYGTLPHPNILGGLLVISLLSTLLFKPHIKHENLAAFIIQLAALFATFSRSALFALSLALIYLGFHYAKNLWRHLQEKREKINLLIISALGIAALQIASLWLIRLAHIFKDGALSERIQGYKYAFLSFLEHPFGLGFRQFTLGIDEISSQNLMPWDYQPVHNVGLLLLTELGVFGLILFALTIILFTHHHQRKSKTLQSKKATVKKRILLAMGIAIFATSLFDHYWLSTDQGLLVLTLFYALYARFSEDPGHVFPLKKEGRLSTILADQ